MLINWSTYQHAWISRWVTPGTGSVVSVSKSVMAKVRALQAQAKAIGEKTASENHDHAKLLWLHDMSVKNYWKIKRNLFDKLSSLLKRPLWQKTWILNVLLLYCFYTDRKGWPETELPGRRGAEVGRQGSRARGWSAAGRSDLGQGCGSSVGASLPTPSQRNFVFKRSKSFRKEERYGKHEELENLQYTIQIIEKVIFKWIEMKNETSPAELWFGGFRTEELRSKAASEVHTDLNSAARY